MFKNMLNLMFMLMLMIGLSTMIGCAGRPAAPTPSADAANYEIGDSSATNDNPAGDAAFKID